MNFEEIDAQLRKLSLRDEDVILWEVEENNAVISVDSLNRFTKVIADFQKQYKEVTGKTIFNLILPAGLVHSVKSITVNQELLKEEKIRKRFSIRRNLYHK